MREEEYVMELGKKVGNKQLSWEEASKMFNNEFKENTNASALKTRYCRYKNKMQNKGMVNETHNQDGSVDITKRIFFNAKEEKTPENILIKFGYDPLKWELTRWVFGSYDTYLRNDGLQEQFTIRATIRPKYKTLSKEEIINITKEVIKENIKPYANVSNKKDKTLDADKMLILSVADLHLGRYCNELDSGTTYNMEIAKEYFRHVIKELIRLQKQKKVGNLLYTIGNDFFNYDNVHGTTTKGTPLQNSVSYREMYKVGLELQIEALKSIKKHFNNIKVVLVQGNHDEILDYTLFLALEQIFANDDIITFNNDYKKTKVEIFGNNSIFMDHGDTNYKRLVQTLPARYSKEYGSTEHRIALLHHLHSQQAIDELTGITAYRLSTLAPTDEYEYKNSFGSVKGTQMLFELDKNYGLESINYIKIK